MHLMGQKLAKFDSWIIELTNFKFSILNLKNSLIEDFQF